jgi:hypothetical protein
VATMSGAHLMGSIVNSNKQYIIYNIYLMGGAIRGDPRRHSGPLAYLHLAHVFRSSTQAGARDGSSYGNCARPQHVRRRVLVSQRYVSAARQLRSSAAFLCAWASCIVMQVASAAFLCDWGTCIVMQVVCVMKMRMVMRRRRRRKSREALFARACLNH